MPKKPNVEEQYLRKLTASHCVAQMLDSEIVARRSPETSSFDLVGYSRLAIVEIYQVREARFVPVRILRDWKDAVRPQEVLSYSFAIVPDCLGSPDGNVSLVMPQSENRGIYSIS